MACDLRPVGVGADSCTESYAGTGTMAYVFFSEDVDLETLQVSNEKPIYEGFALKTGKQIYPIRLKKQANKVVDTSLGDNGGVSNVATVVVDKDLDNEAMIQRTIQNKPCGMLLRKSGIGQGAYILWNPNVDTTFEFSGDTGDTYDADMGSTWTVTSAPMPYARMSISQEDFDKLTIAETGTPPQQERTDGVGVLLKNNRLIYHDSPLFAEEGYTPGEIIGIVLKKEVIAQGAKKRVDIVLSPDEPVKSYFSNGQVGINESLYKYVDRVNEALNDLDGEQNTTLLAPSLTADASWAVNICRNKLLEGNRCYLPALGELKVINDNLPTINLVRTKCGLQELPANSWLWSSSVNKPNESGKLLYVFGQSVGGLRDALNVQGFYLALPIAKLSHFDYENI